MVKDTNHSSGAAGAQSKAVVDEIAAHFKAILHLIGEDPDREGLLKTPVRAAKALLDNTRGYSQQAEPLIASAMFEHPGSDIVIVKDLEFYSLCEHHLLPFYGKVHLAYIPNGRVTGLSKLARTVEVFSRRLQLQERLTSQIANALMDDLGAKGAIVMVEGEHMCMSMRGVSKPGASTATLAKRGVFEDDQALVDEFFRLIGK